jgi:RNA polymerase sigma factor (sigma-70 family)
MKNLMVENETAKNTDVLSDDHHEDSILEGDVEFDEDESEEVLLEVRSDQVDTAVSSYDDALKAYLGTALKYKLLTKAQEIEYATRAQLGEKAAFDAMMLANLRLVVKVARRYTHSKLPIEDLISEGNIGLMMGISKFDPEMGFRFSTYAHHWIRQSITRAIGNQARTVRWPVHVVNKEYQHRKLVEKWTQEGVDFTEKELAEALEISIDKLHWLKNLYRVESSLDAPSMSDDDDRTMQDGLFDTRDDVNESNCGKEQDDHQLSVIMSRTLTQREESVISMRFGLRVNSMTLDQIAAQYGLTRERIRQIESVALRKLKRNLSLNGLHASDFIEGLVQD